MALNYESITLDSLLNSSSTNSSANQHRVQINFPATWKYKPIIGLLNKSIAINGLSANYSNFNVADKVIKLLSSVAGVVGLGELVSGVGGALREGMEGAGIGSLVADSIQVWKGSGTPSVSIELLLLQLEPGSNNTIYKPLSQLMQGVLPSKLGFTVGSTEVASFTAPYGYRPLNVFKDTLFDKKSGYGMSNTVSIDIGDWFKMDGLLIKSATPTFSTAITPDGNPLFCTVGLSLTPYRQMSSDEFMNCFPKAKGELAGNPITPSDTILSVESIVNNVTSAITGIYNRDKNSNKPKT